MAFLYLLCLLPGGGTPGGRSKFVWIFLCLRMRSDGVAQLADDCVCVGKLYSVNSL
jgi:hypothetical protein